MVLIARLLITAIALLLVTYIVPGIEVSSFYVAFVAAIFLGLANAIIRPVLVFLTLPITIITLGIFIFVINAALFWFVASFIDGFAVSGFMPALVGSLLVSFMSGIANRFIT